MVREELVRLSSIALGLTSLLRGKVADYSEDDNIASFSLTIDRLSSMPKPILELIPHSHCIEVLLELQVLNAQTTLRFTKELGLVVQKVWEEDNSIDLPDLGREIFGLFGLFKKNFEDHGQELSITDIDSAMERFRAEIPNDIEFRLRVSFDKSSAVKMVSFDENLFVRLFINNDELQHRFARLDFNALSKSIGDLDKKTVYLLASTVGILSGKYLLFAGRSSWETLSTHSYFTTPHKKELLVDSIKFLREETESGNQIDKITPYHFELSDDLEFNAPELKINIQRLGRALAIIFMASSFKATREGILCEFHGSKKVYVLVPIDLQKGLEGSAISSLFSWAFDGHSSDKLIITRNLITLFLSDDQLENLTLIVDKSQSILDSAKSNYSYYLSKTVAEYFAIRLRVAEYLKEFADRTNTQITALMGDLVSDLYKTFGLVIGILTAKLLRPDISPFLIRASGTAFSIYLVFILLVVLSSKYLAFSSSKVEYQVRVEELKDIYLDSQTISNDALLVDRASKNFKGYVITTISIYVTLTCLVMSFVSAF